MGNVLSKIRILYICVVIVVIVVVLPYRVFCNAFCYSYYTRDAFQLSPFFFVLVFQTANRKTTQTEMSEEYVGIPNVIFAKGRNHPVVESVDDVAS